MKTTNPSEYIGKYVHHTYGGFMRGRVIGISECGKRLKGYFPEDQVLTKANNPQRVNGVASLREIKRSVAARTRLLLPASVMLVNNQPVHII